MLCTDGPHLTGRLSSTGLTVKWLVGDQAQELVYAPVQRLD